MSPVCSVTSVPGLDPKFFLTGRGGGVARMTATPPERRATLRCRAHNQYIAECVFGAEFMKAKREEARRAMRGAG